MDHISEEIIQWISNMPLCKRYFKSLGKKRFTTLEAAKQRKLLIKTKEHRRPSKAISSTTLTLFPIGLKNANGRNMQKLYIPSQEITHKIVWKKQKSWRYCWGIMREGDRGQVGYPPCLTSALTKRAYLKSVIINY